MHQRVLILEDDDDLREGFRAFAATVAHADCIVARNVDELRRAPGALNTDLAFLDVNLGSGEPSGIDAYEWLRTQGYTGRIVFITGHAANHPLVDVARRIAGTYVLSKPVGADQLEDLLFQGTA